MSNVETNSYIEYGRKLHRRITHYRKQFEAKKDAYRDVGLINEFTFDLHVVNEWLLDITERLEKLEGYLEPAPAVEQEVSIPAYREAPRPGGE